jgi:hypothetical protein
MKRILKIIRLLLQIIGSISVLIILGFFIIKMIVQRNNNQEYKTLNLNDGPHIFWLHDSTLKVVDIVHNKNKNTFYTSEYFLNLNDTSSTLSTISNRIRVEFNPYVKPTIEKGTYNASKIAAISDIHGSYNHFVNLLKNNNILDDKMNWQWGNGHLVIVGDVFDKGPGVTKSLWLIKKLEKQAEHDGGKVHYLLGNHEIMVLRGRTDITKLGAKSGSLSEGIDVTYSKLFEANTALGQWLRTKNTIVKINDILFVHGGVSLSIIEKNLTIDKINQYVRELVCLDHWLLADSVMRKQYKFLDSYWGPYNYAGYVGFMGYAGGEHIPEQSMNKILEHFKCKKIVVGHKIVKDIKYLHNNRIIAINIKMPEDDILEEDSKVKMLFIENNKFLKLNINGQKEELIPNL